MERINRATDELNFQERRECKNGTDLEVAVASWPQLKLGEGCSRGHGGDSGSPAALPGACPVPAGRSWGGRRAQGEVREIGAIEWHPKLSATAARRGKKPFVRGLLLGPCSLIEMGCQRLNAHVTGLYSRSRCISSLVHFTDVCFFCCSKKKTLMFFFFL